MGSYYCTCSSVVGPVGCPIHGQSTLAVKTLDDRILELERKVRSLSLRVDELWGRQLRGGW